MTVRHVMSRNGIYGTHFEIIVAAAMMNVRIIVYSPRSTHQMFAFYGRRGLPYIYLFNLDGKSHYDWLQPR
jgi:hypothetical protein